MNKGLLKKATTNSAEPTPGHYYRDITMMTFADGKVCQKVCSFLADRLSSAGATQHYQIIKTLKVIKHCAGAGHQDFQKYFQKQVDDLKTYSTWRGPIDPIHGNSFNDEIKQTARDAIEACFKERIATKQTNPISGQGGGEVTKEQDTFHSVDTTSHSSFGTGVMGSSNGKSRFQEEWDKANGISNPTANSETYLGQLVSAAGKGFGLFGSTNGDHQQMMNQFENQQGAYISVDLPLGEDSKPTFTLPNTQPNAGPAADAPPAEAPATSFSQLMGEDSGPKFDIADEKISLDAGEKLVDTYSALKTVGRVQLNKLGREMKLLTQEERESACMRFDEKLQQKVPWQQRLIALQCIESLADQRQEDILSYFKESPEDIYKNLDVVQGSVKERARKCLTALGLGLTRAAPKAPLPTTTFDYDEAPSNNSLNSIPVSILTGKPEKKQMKIGGLKKRGKKKAAKSEVHADPTPEPEPTGGSMFTGLSMTETPSEPTNAFGLGGGGATGTSGNTGSGGMLFGGMEMNPAVPSAPVQATPVQPTVPLQTTQPPQQQAVVPPATNNGGGMDMFESLMSMNSASKQPQQSQQPQQPPITAPPTNDPLEFLMGAAPKATTTTAIPQQPPAPVATTTSTVCQFFIICRLLLLPLKKELVTHSHPP
eukprot:TRINITY_DN1189_c0_g1_i1.p1 TRINITY_DN1189_c0_g1~~TRINITY_DN1189_c0_g1_i1.p1  ORF type:complete len:654 (+),score=145.97 TRINITY_DN1189_c0_g1_i1:50-2011(+)